jgi:hypothetical protein
MGCFCTDGPSEICTFDATSLYQEAIMVDRLSTVRLSAEAVGTTIEQVELLLNGELFDTLIPGGEEVQLSREWPDGAGFWDLVAFADIQNDTPFDLTVRVVPHAGDAVEVTHSLFFGDVIIVPDVAWRSEIISVVADNATEHDAHMVEDEVRLAWLGVSDRSSLRQIHLDRFPAADGPGSPVFDGPLLADANDITLLSSEQGDAVATSTRPAAGQRYIDFRLFDESGSEGAQARLPPDTDTSRTGSARRPAIGWAGRHFGVAWEDVSSRSIHFALLNEEGSLESWAPVQVSHRVTTPQANEIHRSPVLLPHNDQGFLLLWITRPTSATSAGPSAIQGLRMKISDETVSPLITFWEEPDGLISAIDAVWGIDQSDGALVFAMEDTAGAEVETALHYGPLLADNLQPEEGFIFAEVGRSPGRLPEDSPISLTAMETSWGQRGFAVAWATGAVHVAAFTPEGIPLTDSFMSIQLPPAMSLMPRAPVLLWAGDFFVLVYQFGTASGGGRQVAATRLFLEEIVPAGGEPAPGI